MRAIRSPCLWSTNDYSVKLFLCIVCSFIAVRCCTECNLLFLGQLCFKSVSGNRLWLDLQTIFSCTISDFDLEKIHRSAASLPHRGAMIQTYRWFLWCVPPADWHARGQNVSPPCCQTSTPPNTFPHCTIASNRVFGLANQMPCCV